MGQVFTIDEVKRTISNTPIVVGTQLKLINVAIERGAEIAQTLEAINKIIEALYTYKRCVIFLRNRGEGPTTF